MTTNHALETLATLIAQHLSDADQAAAGLDPVPLARHSAINQHEYAAKAAPFVAVVSVWAAASLSWSPDAKPDTEVPA